jgi:hypothetical protein
MFPHTGPTLCYIRSMSFLARVRQAFAKPPLTAQEQAVIDALRHGSVGVRELRLRFGAAAVGACYARGLIEYDTAAPPQSRFCLSRVAT